MNMKEGDYIEHLHVCSTHDYLLFFTNQGKVYRLKVYELPEGTRASRGRALVNVLPLRDKERVMAVIPTRDFSEGKFLVFGTAQGMVKKTPFKDYDTPIRADGIIAIKIRKGDELVRVRMTSGKDDIIMVSMSGHAARFNEKLALPMGRGTSGVKGMNVSDKGNEVLSSTSSAARTAPRGDRERLRQADEGERIPGQGPRYEGRADRQAHREKGRPRRRPHRPGEPGADLHLPERDGPTERRVGYLPDGSPDPGGQVDESEEGRSGQRRRPGGRVHGAERQWSRADCGFRRGRGPTAERASPRRPLRPGRRQRRGEGDQVEVEPGLEGEAAEQAEGQGERELPKPKQSAKPKPAAKPKPKKSPRAARGRR
jgi:hypothetical protein